MNEWARHKCVHLDQTTCEHAQVYKQDSDAVCLYCKSNRQNGCRQLLTESGAMQLGLGIALEYILDIGVDNIWKQIQVLAGTLRDKLRELPGVTVLDKGRLLCGIVSFTLVGFPSPSNPHAYCPLPS